MCAQAYRRLIRSASTLSAVHEGIHTPREVASEPFEPGIDLGEFSHRNARILHQLLEPGACLLAWSAIMLERTKHPEERSEISFVHRSARPAHPQVPPPRHVASTHPSQSIDFQEISDRLGWVERRIDAAR